MNDNKNILAIETSSNICGIAYIKKGVCVGSVEHESSKKHAEILPAYYLELLKQTEFVLEDIDAIAISIGPGSFTGLRIGLGFAKGLAFSKGLPIIPVSTMMSLAYGLKESLPDMGIIYSHAERVFYQNIIWDHDIPYSSDDICVTDWENLLEKIDYSKKIFHWNCGSLNHANRFVLSKLTSSSIGLLASNKYEELIINNPFELVPNYVSPFVVGKKK